MNHYQSVVIQEMKSKALHLEAAAATIRGQRRKVNEDAVFHHIEQKDTGENLGLFIVCDGMGGHEAGEIASQMAIQTVSGELGTLLLDGNPPTWPTLHHWVRTAVARANHKIWQYAQTLSGQTGTDERRQPGTTITLSLVYGNLAAIANVGDSRTCLWRAGQLRQITRDHSLVTRLVEEGLLSAQDTADHPYRNILDRALGLSEDVTVDLFEVKVHPGDMFLLCSDGVWHAFADAAELGRRLTAALSPDELCHQLVEEAGDRYGADDMSALVVSVDA